MSQGLIRILLIDDNPAFIESLRRFLSAEPGIQVVGYAHSGREGIELAGQLEPNLVLIDFRMPGMNGLEATYQIKAQSHMPRVILLTLNDEPEYHALARTVRADAFIPKAEIGTQLLEQISLLFDLSDKKTHGQDNDN